MNLEDIEEYSRLLLTVEMRSGGIGTPDTMYLKIRACCSNSCHWLVVNIGDLFLPIIIISFPFRTSKIKVDQENDRRGRTGSTSEMASGFRVQVERESCVVGLVEFKGVVLQYPLVAESSSVHGYKMLN